MAEAQTPSTAAPEITGGSSSNNNGTNGAAKPEKVSIKVSGVGGGFSLDEFQRALGQETENSDEATEPEVEEGTGELRDLPEGATDDPILEDKEDTDEEEKKAKEEDVEDEDERESGEMSLEEVGKTAKKGGIKGYTKDGKTVTLPHDLEIEQTVDGETRRINLREHLNVVAGEIALDDRLSQVGSFRGQVEARRKEIEGIHTKFFDDINTLVGYVKQGKPDFAICYLAEMNGTSPIEMKRHFLKSLVAEATKFEGKSQVEIENYYLNLEKKWRADKDAKFAEKQDKQKKANNFVEYVTQQLKSEGVSPEEFTKASNQLKEKGELNGLSQDARLDRVIEHALLVKHVDMAKSAIALVDPKLIGNRKLFDLLLQHTHPKDYTVEEMADVLSEYLGVAKTRIASSLSKKVRPQQVQARSERQNGAGKKQRTYRSQGDLARAFGL